MALNPLELHAPVDTEDLTHQILPLLRIGNRIAVASRPARGWPGVERRAVALHDVARVRVNDDLREIIRIDVTGAAGQVSQSFDAGLKLHLLICCALETLRLFLVNDLVA